jgi:hypothetical protein
MKSQFITAEFWVFGILFLHYFYSLDYIPCKVAVKREVYSKIAGSIWTTTSDEIMPKKQEQA